MVKRFESIAVWKQIKDLIVLCETEYRKNHPELDGIPLSKSKILFEVMIFYLPKKDEAYLRDTYKEI